MVRYFIELAYNGSRYHGWQIQPGASSVQEESTGPSVLATPGHIRRRRR